VTASTALRVVEGATVALALSSIVWVLVIQSIGLLRSMPRARFLPLQMQLVRVWSRALVGITAVAALAAIARAGLHAWPALVAFVAAGLCGAWAIPRALRSGGEALHETTSDALSSKGFLADGGGAATRVWHRVVLACMAVVITGLTLDARALAGGPSHQPSHQPSHEPPHEHGHEHGPATTSTTATRGPRARIDRATVENIARLERDTAAVLAGGASGEVSVLRASYQRIFSQCTTQGEDHVRLHGFLLPIGAALERVESREGAQRRDAVRALLRELGRFDEGFEAAP
jgi:hypothetical protein